ncbi:MAG TPA: hypothetical protein VFO18_08670 [Methylomirabilota bacterium]|nr:hypothetical protein [Methylomirabilota bacterium]
MRELIESVAIEGMTLTVTLSPTLPVDVPTLAVAAAIRALHRYPVLDRVTVRSGSTEVGLSRREVEQLLQPDDLAAAKEPDRWKHVLARAVERFLAR